MAIQTEVQLVLASASPRRQELIKLLNLPFTVRVSSVDEVPQAGEAPLHYVQRMASEKAAATAAVYPSENPNEVMIASDTDVVFEDEIFGKPRDGEEATAMLKRLRGKTHEVITAITLVEPATGNVWQDVCRSPVPIRNYSDAEIEAYVASGDPLDKAGAYAIHHQGFHPVESFSHCFAGVMGLPLCHLTRTLRRAGIEPQANVPAACQTFIQYDCPVYREILNDADIQ